MKHPHLWLRAISVVAIIAVMVALPGASSPASTQQAWPAAGIAYAEKIDQEVWKALETAPDGKVAVLVKLAEQADLSAASRIEDWNARGWAVYNALSSTAERTQPDVMARIQIAEAAGQASDAKSFWIVNLISLRADQATIIDLASMPQVGAILPAFKLEKPDPVVEDPGAAPEADRVGRGEDQRRRRVDNLRRDRRRRRRGQRRHRRAVRPSCPG